MPSLVLDERWMQVFLARAQALLPGLPGDPRALAHTLAQGVVALSSGLTRSRALAGRRYLEERDLAVAYLLYYLPVQVLKVGELLRRALRAGWWHPAPTLQVTELGCGPGAGLWGTLEALLTADSGVNLPRAIHYQGIDQSRAALETLRALELPVRTSGLLQDRAMASRGIPPLAVALETRIARIPEEKSHPDPARDLVIISYTINELVDSLWRTPDAAWPWLQRMLERLSPGGLLVLLEPGVQAASRFLGGLRDLAVKEAGILVRSPCTHAWPCPLLGPGAPGGQWCHQELRWQRPALIEAVDRLTGLNKSRVAFSHLVLQRALEPPEVVADGTARPASAASWEGEFRALSPALKARGTVTIHLCGAGGFREARLLTRHLRPGNEAWLEVERGDRITLSGAEEKGNVLQIGAASQVALER